MIGKTTSPEAAYMREYRKRPVPQQRHRESSTRWQREHPEQARAISARYRARHRKPPTTLSDRFWSKVEKGDGCWLWVASLSTHGYGQIRVDGTMQRAHRVVWFLTYGEWPAGSVLHSCDTPRCVRPEHLREGTQADNLRDASSRGRIRNQHGAAPAKAHW